MEVRGVTFDLDDTLWCGKQVIRRASACFHAFLQSELPALAAAFPPAAFDAQLTQLMREQPEHAHDYTFLRKQTLRRCADAVAHDLALSPQQLDAALEAAFDAFLVARSQPEFFPGVDDLLLQLEQLLAATSGSRNISSNDTSAASDTGNGRVALLGVITNGNCVLEQLPPTFRARMHFMISAERVGCAKPARAIFDAAVAHFPDVSTAAAAAADSRAHIVHVGDHYACDVVGAKQAGLRTIWVNAAWPKPNALHRRDLAPSDAEQFRAADAIVRDVTAVLDVVALWNREAAAAARDHSSSSATSH